MARRRPQNAKAGAYRSAGVIIMGLGAAMFVLLSFVPRIPAVGFGVGGAIFVSGLPRSS